MCTILLNFRIKTLYFRIKFNLITIINKYKRTTTPPPNLKKKKKLKQQIFESFTVKGKKMVVAEF